VISSQADSFRSTLDSITAGLERRDVCSTVNTAVMYYLKQAAQFARNYIKNI
jgi:hypothetical protein